MSAKDKIILVFLFFIMFSNMAMFLFLDVQVREFIKDYETVNNIHCEGTADKGWVCEELGDK